MATRKLLPSNSHFFQPLLPGFEHGISIPVSFFSKHLKGQKEYEKALLRGPGGKVWVVKLKGRHFGEGWKELVKEHDLHVGDFLVFGHEGNLVFDFKVFDRSACEREYPFLQFKQEILPLEEQEENQVLHKSSPGSDELKKKKKNKKKKQVHSSASCFLVKVTAYNARRPQVIIPMKFAKENGLLNRYGNVILMNQQGRTWIAHLRQRKSGQVHIGQGWIEFRKANKLKPGDSFMFELIIEKGEKPLFKMKKMKMMVIESQFFETNMI